MNCDRLDEWLIKLKNIWVDKNPEGLKELFPDKFMYFETPFEKPHTTKKDLINLWQDVPKSQDNTKFSYKIISFSHNLGIVHWNASFVRKGRNIKAYLDGIFQIQLDNDGLCTEFKQWWITKEITA